MLPLDRLREAVAVLRTEQALRDLKEQLGGAGVPFLVLKGVHLGAAYYPRPEARPHVDIDILVRRSSFPQACAALERGGFKRMDSRPDRPATERSYYNYSFVSRHGTVVELHRHWAGHGRYPMDAEGFFQRAVSFRYGNTELLGLCPEDLLLHLCVHMAKSYFAFQQLKHLEDVAAVLNKQPLDWAVFLRRARDAHCRVGSYYALLAAREQCTAPVPDEVLAALRPSAWRRKWIAATLDPKRFPLSCIPETQVGRIRARLTVPLLDRPSDWGGVLARYLLVRLLDLVERPPER